MLAIKSVNHVNPLFVPSPPSNGLTSMGENKKAIPNTGMAYKDAKCFYLDSWLLLLDSTT